MPNVFTERQNRSHPLGYEIAKLGPPDMEREWAERG